MKKQEPVIEFKPVEFSDRIRVDVDGRCAGHIWPYGDHWSCGIGNDMATFHDNEEQARKAAIDKVKRGR